MDLLDENKYETPKAPKGRNLVLFLIILSVIFALIIIIAMFMVKERKAKMIKLYINGKKVTNINDYIINDSETSKTYISIKALTTALGYQYNNSAYQEDGIDTTKCFIENQKLIYGFELGSNKVYKYEEQTNLDYQYYYLNTEIKTFNNKLFIDLEDLKVGLNLQCTRNKNNEIYINDIIYLKEKCQEKLADSGYELPDDYNNLKALAYEWIIVKKNDTYGVLNFKLDEIITRRYDSIYFDEQNLNYIVSNSNGKYGIISSDGTVKMQFKYDNLEVLNYENKLYKAKSKDKYGIIKSDGSILVNFEYDDIGFPRDDAKDILYTLIVEKLKIDTSVETPKRTIVVKNNDKYGLVIMETGQLFLPCDELDKIYSIEELGEIKYKAEMNNQVMDLSDYVGRRIRSIVGM